MVCVAVESDTVCTYCAASHPASYPSPRLIERLLLGRTVTDGELLKYHPRALFREYERYRYPLTDLRLSVYASAAAVYPAGLLASGPPRVSRSSNTWFFMVRLKSASQKFRNRPKTYPLYDRLIRSPS